jgi:hypothetical protein
LERIAEVGEFTVLKNIHKSGKLRYTYEVKARFKNIQNPMKSIFKNHKKITINQNQIYVKPFFTIPAVSLIEELIRISENSVEKSINTKQEEQIKLIRAQLDQQFQIYQRAIQFTDAAVISDTASVMENHSDTNTVMDY